MILFLPIVLCLLIPWLFLRLPANSLYGWWLKLRWEQVWGRQGKRILLVYSRSPNWQSYIETAWLPRIAPHAVVVDWSTRHTWPRRAPLEIRAFRHWSGDREFNPLALLFPQRGRVRTIRFWKAFHAFKRGSQAELRTAEDELFAFVDSSQGDTA